MTIPIAWFLAVRSNIREIVYRTAIDPIVYMYYGSVLAFYDFLSLVLAVGMHFDLKQAFNCITMTVPHLKFILSDCIPAQRLDFSCRMLEMESNLAGRAV